MNGRRYEYEVNMIGGKYPRVMTMYADSVKELKQVIKSNIDIQWRENKLRISYRENKFYVKEELVAEINSSKLSTRKYFVADKAGEAGNPFNRELWRSELFEESEDGYNRALALFQERLSLVRGPEDATKSVFMGYEYCGRTLASPGGQNI